MKWDYWMKLYTRTHCVARGLRPSSIAAYEASLEQFRKYVQAHVGDRPPDEIRAREILAYLQHLRIERRNGDSAVNRHVVILRSFYRAMVAMGYLDHADNPMAGFPTVKATPKKLPVTLSQDEIERLLSVPKTDTVLGIRDRALLTLLYGTGIRASECATLQDRDVDLATMTVTVTGKGGHQRTVPLNETVVAALQVYCSVRGDVKPTTGFFRSRLGRAMTRSAIYERVRSWGSRARIRKIVSPHRLRHTFATHLVRAGVGIVTIRDLLGHRLITSTQIYLHVTGQELRAAAERHPIGRLLGIVAHLLPDVKLPLQRAPA
jgi:site-specific recombinase XerD